MQILNTLFEKNAKKIWNWDCSFSFLGGYTVFTFCSKKCEKCWCSKECHKQGYYYYTYETVIIAIAKEKDEIKQKDIEWKKMN